MTIPKIKEVSDTLELIKERIVLVNDQLLWKATGNPVSTETHHNGYVRLKIGTLNFYYHRVVFFLHSGLWPDMVDHKDGDKLNNHPSNLRAATASENAMNKRKASNNTSGFKGVSFHKHSEKWRARIRYNGKSYSIGYYETAEDAAKAYDITATVLFSEFALVNDPEETERLLALAQLRIFQQKMIDEGFAPELVY